MKKTRMILVGTAAFVILAAVSSAQKIETANGVRLVHNEKSGGWGSHPKVGIEMVRTIGGLDADENLSFRSPYDIARDSAGNLYILDMGNRRIQKLSSEGKFIKTIGRPGQGPGEFQAPFSLDVDGKDLIFVCDALNRLVQVFEADGRPIRSIKLAESGIFQIRRLPSGLIVKGGEPNLRDLLKNPKKIPPLLELIDLNGNVKKSFGEATDYKDSLVNSTANKFALETDGEGNIYLGFWYQNRIDKYSPEGALLWRADRPLNYGTDVIDKGFIQRDEKGTAIQEPKLNMISMGAAVDGKGRVWINTYNRQISPEDEGMGMSVGGVQRTIREPKNTTMDVYKLEIFSPEGILLGEIPLNHRAHGLRIFGDNLFIWERNDTTYYHYKVIEK
jgi:sugar lactone lactonase YvrE